MMSSSKSPGRQWRRRALLLLPLVGVALLMWKVRDGKTPAPVDSRVAAPLELLRGELVLVNGRLCRAGTSNDFTGLMVERFSDGTMRSRTVVSNGLLHGLSEGWYTNGQLQVTEHFKAGVSHGLRVKWHPNGLKASEAQIVDGRLHGRFVSWHDNGVKATEAEFKHGQPDGLSSAYFPSGALKSQVTAREGTVVDRKAWRDGEFARTDPAGTSSR